MIKSGIVGFSFDREASSSIADEKIISAAKKYKKSGRSVSHHIRRAQYGTVDNLKFNYLIYGVPMAVWVMRNIIGSKLENVVFVGSEETREIFYAAKAFFDESIGGKNLEFVLEGEKTSLFETFRRGKEKLDSMTNGATRNQLIYFQAGDIPFFTDINSVLADTGIHDVVLDLNSRERIFGENVRPEDEFFKRNYYWKVVENDGKPHSVKEPNVWLLNIDALDENVVNYMTRTRKGGKLRLSGLLAKALLKSGGLGLVKQAFSTWRAGQAHCAFLEGLGNAIVGGRIKVKAKHNDLSRMADVDSYEDWRYYEEVCERAARGNSEGLGYIYQHAEDIERFGADIMPGLRKKIPMYSVFEGFVNGRFGSFGLPMPYDREGIRISLPGTTLTKAVEYYHRKLSFSQTQG